MRTRCRRCARLTTTRYACKSCGSSTHLIHCHDRAHAGHDTRNRARGYAGEDLGTCPSFTLAGLHLHPYNDPKAGLVQDHRNEPAHYVGTDLAPPIADWLGQPVTGQTFEEKP